MENTDTGRTQESLEQIIFNGQAHKWFESWSHPPESNRRPTDYETIHVRNSDRQKPATPKHIGINGKAGKIQVWEASNDFQKAAGTRICVVFEFYRCGLKVFQITDDCSDFRTNHQRIVSSNLFRRAFFTVLFMKMELILIATKVADPKMERSTFRGAAPWSRGLLFRALRC